MSENQRDELQKAAEPRMFTNSDYSDDSGPGMMTFTYLHSSSICSKRSLHRRHHSSVSSLLDTQFKNAAGERVSTVFSDSSEDSVQTEEWSGKEQFGFERTVSASGDWASGLGAYSTRAFCTACKVDVSTAVTVRHSTLPLWRAVCMLGDFFHCCSQTPAAPLPLEVLHSCRHCKKLLARVSLT